ncbi:MAG: cupin domain-containing protein [Ekhidna sp.]|nr:cupin domain-containing protein [Ekhidna sp.]
MEVKKLEFPQEGDYYLKNILEKREKGVNVQCGSVRLTKGEVLPFKTLDLHEVAYLISGKLEVSTEDGQKSIMNEGDLIYLNKDEVRRTETLENSLILFFLFTET